MTQEKANRIFETDLGRQLSVIYVTPDDMPFIRREEAVNYCHDILEHGDDITKYEITEWYPED
jgi:hypothetical protein